MKLEEQRYLHEDIERLEDAISERMLDDPKHIRERLARDHEVSRFLESIEERSKSLDKIYEDVDGDRDREVRGLSTGDTMDAFLREVASIRDYHRRYPNEQAENLEKMYKKRTPEEQAAAAAYIESMFSGEEGIGRFFDLTSLYDQFLNLPNNQSGRRLTYLQFIDSFDNFQSIRREQKMSETYFQYLKALQEYLEGFMRRTKPLENLDKIFTTFDKDFEEAWEKDEVPGWEKNAGATNGSATAMDTSGGGIYCSACKKDFSKESVYESHLSGKKHKKNAEQMENAVSSINSNGPTSSVQRIKERVVAEKEFRVKKLAAAMQTERSDTKVNVERKQGMTERERQQELEMLYSETTEQANKDDDDDSDGEDKIYNPLKLPLAWDGKPIPFWLYKLHGLGVEFPCEICGNFVYMGRRAFDKHFNEPRHVYGLKCLGITNTTLFREITGISEALELWKKIQAENKKQKSTTENVVQMEDTDGNVMPEKVYQDLLAQGIL
ncbi:hypothetical protein BDV96DRAFT_507646 [Lophiotrema nucula]|uniref:Matrin-type domain-containing protein n=1 Tax=Lophiotrema nucula TaxID=690887 RepID=A0A6A5YHN4_9PLEO|nr:hypothetical protein BDV96DRAFT_507646 [Lophiotrema nucula]